MELKTLENLKLVKQQLVRNKKVAYTFWSLLPNSYQQKSGLILLLFFYCTSIF